MRQFVYRAAILAALGTVVALAVPASAAGPTAVTLSGPGLAGPLTVAAEADPELFKDLLSEVDWLASRPGNAPEPDPATLGPKYQVVVLVGTTPSQAYDLYPLAAGGPRVFRPAKQPARKSTAAWLYGRVSMPDTLRQAGVPLVLTGRIQPGTKENSTGGQGGGTGQGSVGAVASPTPPSGLGPVLQEWNRGMLLVGGGALVLLVLLAGAALLVRRGP